MIAWGRTLLAAALALLVMLAIATQLVAWVFDQHRALGEAVAVVGGVKLYAPWQVLIWTLQWFAHDAWMALLHVGLIGMALLAAFGLAGLLGAIEPPSFALRLWRPGFERWAKLGQRGLLRGDGLALGAVRRHALARLQILRLHAGHALLLGAPVHTDDALIAAIASWRGALVLIEARDRFSSLPRQDLLRFAPGRADAIAINPLLGVRGGAHAWSDALTLARAFLRTDDGMLVASFAALVLDTLAHAPPAARSFSGMRQALADPQRRLAEFCARWADGVSSDLGPATGELTRIARYWRRDGDAALRAIRDIDIRLAAFADGDHALATEGHQLRFADLVSGDGPSSLVVQMPPGGERLTAPLVSALLAQLVAACAAATDLDHLGRRKQRELLIVVEANALAALVVDPGPTELANPPRRKTAPRLFDGPMCGACERGVRVLVQSACASDAGMLIGADADHLAAELTEAFAAIAVIGPQTDTSAEVASTLAGQVHVWRRWRRQAGGVSRWLLPHRERIDAQMVAPEALRRAEAEEALLLLAGLKPIRGRSLISDRTTAAFIDAASIARAPHDWEAPPLPAAAVSASSTLSLPPDKENAVANVQAPIAGSKLRRALARRAAPALKPDRGGRLI